MKITATPKCSFFLLLLAGGTAPQRDAVFGFTTTTSNSRRTPRNTPFQSGATTVLYSASPVVPEETTRKVSKSVTAENASITASAATATSDATTIPTARSSPQSASPLGTLSAAIFGTTNEKQGNNSGTREYQRGLITIGFITLLFSSNSPVLHAAFHQTDGGATPPVLLLNAAVSAVALVGLLLGGETLEQNTDLPSTLQQQQQQQSLGGGVQEPQESFLESQESSVGSTTTTTNNNPLQLSLTPEDKLVLRGGCELGLWKFLGTTANIYGLSLTTAAHGAFLIQLTTLIVPVIQSIQGVPIPKRIQWSIVLALAGVVCFTQDPTGTPSLVGDGLCVLAAIFYATYDLRLFSWGKQVVPRRLITGKIATQAMLSLGLLLTAGSTSGLFGGAASSSLDTVSDLSAWQETIHYLSDNPQWTVLIPVVLWSGVVVNALAPFLQVAGQQAVGPTRCQTIYASQPLWAGIMGFVVFGDTIGWQGVVGGSAFLTALFLAATTEAPDAECGKKQCEV